MKIREVVTPWWADAPSEEHRLALLMQQEGIDLKDASGKELARGTPIYVLGDTDLIEVQRLMARNHIRRLPVIDGGELIGIVDLVDLALSDQEAAG